jgi:hypothetical protein
VLAVTRRSHTQIAGRICTYRYALGQELTGSASESPPVHITPINTPRSRNVTPRKLTWRKTQMESLVGVTGFEPATSTSQMKF